MNTVSHLLSVVDAYQVAIQRPDKTISSRVFADSKKISAMRAGADITTGRCSAALQWFSDHWPSDAKWPTSVVRPSTEIAA